MQNILLAFTLGLIFMYYFSGPIDIPRPGAIPGPYPPHPDPQVPEPTGQTGGLISNLESISKAMKKCSKDLFDFEIENDSLFKVSSGEGNENEVVNKHLDIILWIHKKITVRQSTWVKLLITRPDNIPRNKIPLGQIAEDLVLADSRSYHELDSLNK